MKPNTNLEVVLFALKSDDHCKIGLAWDILTALRGPDSDRDDYKYSITLNEELKLLTTSRIRGFIFEGEEDVLKGVSAKDYVRHSRLSKDERDRRNTLFTFRSVSSHFVNHYNAAVRAIQALFGYSLFSEKEWKGWIYVISKEKFNANILR